MLCFERDIAKVENTLLQWILEYILENQTFQRIAKFIMADFYEMDFMKGIVILVKVDEMYNILKPATHGLLVERWDGNGYPYVYYVPPLKRARFHLVRDIAI